MLFARLKGKHKHTLASIVNSLAHNTTRHLAHKLFLTAHIANRRTSERHRNAERLSVTYSYICIPFAWSLQHGKVGSHTINDKQSLVCMTRVGKARVVFYNAIIVRLLYNNSCYAATLKTLVHTCLVGCAFIGFNQFDVKSMEVGVCLYNVQHLRVYRLGYKHSICLLGSCHSHNGSLGSCSRAVVHRSVRYIHAGKLGHHALVFKDIV